MKIGYIDTHDLSTCQLENGIFYKDNTFYMDRSNNFFDTIDLKELFLKHKVDATLEKIVITGNEEELINSEILCEFCRVKEVYLHNIEINNLNWLQSLTEVQSFTLSGTTSFGNDIMVGSFYHPISYLTKLEHLDLSVSNFSEDAIYISKKHSIFDDMKLLNYLNLRETNLSDDSFLALIKSKDILINFMDNRFRLDFSKYDNIRLVTKIKLMDGSIMDISKYIGK